MSAPAEQSRRDGELPPLLDVFLDVSRLGGRSVVPGTLVLLVILLVCGVVFGTGMAFRIPRPSMALLSVGTFVGLVALWRVGAGYSRRRFARALEPGSDSRGLSAVDFGEVLKLSLSTIGTWNFDGAADELALRLLRDGRAGQIVRACRETEAFAAAPIRAVFEPVKLDSSDPAFRELVEAVDQSAAASAEDERQRRRRRNPSDRAGRYAIDLFVVAFCVVMMLNAGGVAPKAIGGGMLALWACWRIIPALLSERQWVLVPGGVLVRRARGMGKQWHPRLFTRGESVLVVWSIERSGQTAWVGLLRGDAGKESIELNGEECEMLLRAWLSEAGTPGLERLGDWA